MWRHSRENWDHHQRRTFLGPWSDKSYLTEADLRNPDIVGNVRAIDEVCEMVSFVAETDGGELIGYWRGPNDTAAGFGMVGPAGLEPATRGL